VTWGSRGGAYGAWYRAPSASGPDRARLQCPLPRPASPCVGVQGPPAGLCPDPLVVPSWRDRLRRHVAPSSALTLHPPPQAARLPGRMRTGLLRRRTLCAGRPVCWAWAVEQARHFVNALLPSPWAGCGARGSPLGTPSRPGRGHLHADMACCACPPCGPETTPRAPKLLLPNRGIPPAPGDAGTRQAAALSADAFSRARPARWTAALRSRP
jgi:hypothetical protein